LQTRVCSWIWASMLSLMRSSPLMGGRDRRESRGLGPRANPGLAAPDYGARQAGIKRPTPPGSTRFGPFQPESPSASLFARSARRPNFPFAP